MTDDSFGERNGGHAGTKPLAFAVTRDRGLLDRVMGAPRSIRKSAGRRPVARRAADAAPQLPELATVASRLRRALEARGDHPKLANLPDGWFAVVPEKWARLVERATREGREGPYLIVYRTRTTDVRDHYVVPYALAQTLLTERTAPARRNGKRRRWELLIRGGQLKVTHGATVDVSAFHRAPLPGEVVDHENGGDDADDAAYFEAHEGRAVWVTHRRRERDHALSAEARRRARAEPQGLACRACGFDFERVYGALGSGFVEIHHAVPLSECDDEGHRTRVEDLVPVCSNCHRMLHRRRPWLGVSDLTAVLFR